MDRSSPILSSPTEQIPEKDWLCRLRRQSSQSPAFALVSTLLIIAALTVMMVAFMQSMRIERMTARSYLDLGRAELAAQSGLMNAKVLILDSVRSSGGANFLTWSYSTNANFTNYYVGILTNAIPTSTAPGSITMSSLTNTVWLASGPLRSGRTSVDLRDLITLPAANKVNINWKTETAGQASFAIDPSGAAYNVGWVDIPPPPGAREKTRYAFWVADESSKIDLSTVGNTTQTVPIGDLYTPLPENLILKNAGSDSVDPTNWFSPTDATPSTLVSKRTFLSYMTPDSVFPMAPSVAGAPPAGRALLVRDKIRHTVSTQKKFSGTIDASDLIPYGPKVGQPKINLNDLVANTTLSKVDKVQKIHDAIRDSLPEYYKRKNSPPGNVMRIAASIHDYISADSYPTLAPDFDQKLTNSLTKAYTFLIQNNGTGTPPSASDWNPSWGGLNLEKRWYGIKRVPLFNALNFVSAQRTSSGSYTVNYEFRLWNMHDAAISVPGTPYIFVWNSFFTAVSGAVRADNGAPVQGLPYFRFDMFPVPGGNISLSPRELRTVNLSKTYRITSAVNVAMAGGDQMGFILCTRDSAGKFHVLDGFFTTGTFSDLYNGQLSYPSPGGQVTGSGADGYWDVKDRRQNLGLLNGIWTVGGTYVSGNLANYQLLNKWYDQPANISTDPISHIAQAPMKSIGELGNIFDPINDIGVAADTNARYASTDAGINGNQVGRGSKTLNTGQFDVFFDQLQTANPRNQAISDCQNWTSYEKYLRYADAALFDIFTVRTADQSAKSRPLNINTPLPKSTTITTLDPFATYASALQSIVSTAAPMSGSGYSYTKTVRASTMADAVRARLSHPTDWTQCRPFRNINDLALLGITKEVLNANSNLWTAANNQNSYFNTGGLHLLDSPSSNTVLLSAQRNPRTDTVLKASNAQRQKLLPRFAEQLSLRSYRYRLYAVGQVYQDSITGKLRVLATSRVCYQLDLNPRYTSPDPADPFAPAGTLTYEPTLKKIGAF